jgi:AcrR family transcriptional regulator
MSNIKPKRTRLSPEARQDHLLDCSSEMITADGLAGFTMEGLAKRANVSAPLVYNYFPNRIELLRTLLKREFARFNKRTANDAEQATSFEDIVRVAVRSNFEHYAPGTALPILITQPEIASVVQNSLVQHSRQAASYLIEKAAEHYRLDEDTARLIVQLSSGAAWSAAELAGKRGLSMDETVELTTNYIIAGIETLVAGKKNAGQIK